jgi:hypothetical protein
MALRGWQTDAMQLREGITADQAIEVLGLGTADRPGHAAKPPDQSVNDDEGELEDQGEDDGPGYVKWASLKPQRQPFQPEDEDAEDVGERARDGVHGQILPVRDGRDEGPL